MLFICSMSEGSFRRFWGWNRRNARLVLGLNGLLTALIEEWEASAAAGGSSSANTGSSQSNVPGEMQSKHVGYYVWRAVWYWACTSDFCNMQNWHHCETFSAWLGSAWWWTKRVFIVFIVSLLAHSGALARLCVHAAVPELHPTALLSVWNSPAFRESNVEFMVDNFWQKSQWVKEQSCLPQTAACGEGGEHFSLPWPCLQHRDVQVSRGAGEEPLIPTSGR